MYIATAANIVYGPAITAGSIWRDEDGDDWRVVAVVDGRPFVKPKRRPLAASLETERAWFAVWTRIA